MKQDLLFEMRHLCCLLSKMKDTFSTWKLMLLEETNPLWITFHFFPVEENIFAHVAALPELDST